MKTNLSEKFYEMRAKVLAVMGELLAGERAIYRGPLRDNQGREPIAAGVTIAIQDPALDGMDWLLEGIQGDVAKV